MQQQVLPAQAGAVAVAGDRRRRGRAWVGPIDEQKARGPVARPKHGRRGTAQARHKPEDAGPGLGTARVPGRAWAARQARRVARHGPQLVEGTVEAR